MEEDAANATKEMKDTSVVISAQAELNSPNELTITVGDRIQFIQGPRVEGLIYYLDEEKLLIRPDGLSDRLVEVPTDVFADESVEVKIQDSPLHTFIEIADLQVGNDVQTYDENGQPTGIYQVKSLNLENDSAVFINKETEDELLLEFTANGIIRGIPPDVPFKVLLPQDPGKKEIEVQEDEKEEEEEAINIEEIVEEPELEEAEEVYGKGRAEDIVYEDDEQKNDFLQLELAAEKPERRNNPNVRRKIVRLMENCYQLRNDILERTESGRIEPKQVAYTSLAELLTNSDFPLAKQVLQVAKSLYFDHTENHFLQKSVDVLDTEDTSIDPHYLDDTLKDGIAFIEDQFKRKGDAQPSDSRQLPYLYTVFQLFYNDYYRVLKPMKGGKKTVAMADRDFFRVNPVGLLEKPLKGLENVGGDDIVLSQNNIQTIGLSYMRSIRSRIGKYGERKLKITGPIEQGDEAEIRFYILFPFLFLRDLGAIRSGKLSIDIGNGMGIPKTIDTILIEGGGIQTIAKAGDIVAVDPEGETTGNIEIESWLSGQSVYGNGLGDILPFLKSLGMDKAEFTPEQQQVLLKKIQAYQANLKKYLLEMRKKARDVLENPHAVQSNNLLGEDDSVLKFLASVVRDEALLIDALADFKRTHPSWQKNDIASFSYLYKKYPDFTLASASGQPDVALERKRVVDDMYLQRVNEALELRKKVKDQGEPPVVNECPHVKNLETIRKIKDDDQRIQIIIRELLPRFQGITEDHWIECRICNQHLLCEHEYLMLLERTHPNQQAVIHKKILLNYSDGVFNGKFICGNCGQAIQDLDFDDNIEFDDEGRPMMGNEPLNQQMETSLAKEIDKLLEVTTETFTEKPRETARDQNLRITLMDEIAKKVGVYLSSDSIDRMLRVVDRILENRTYKDVASYNAAIRAAQKEQQEKGEKASAFPTYEEYFNQFTITTCGAMTFIEIQTAVPDFVLRGAAQGCGDATFDGFPLLPDEGQVEGMKYMACAIASLIRAEKPWGETMWAKKMVTKDALARRTTSILSAMKKQIDAICRESEIQTRLEKKREYIRKEKGEQALTGRYKDEIPPDFLPAPTILSQEEIKVAAAAPTIGEAAKPAEKASAWLRQGYALARLYGKYEPGNPLSEASCCYSSLESPMSFWREQAMLHLNPKLPPQGPRGSVLTLKAVIRKPEDLLGKPNPQMMYRLFLRVCFQGPRTGLSHEPGYNNICPYCEFNFPVDPRLPPPQISYSKDKKVQEKYDDDYKSEVQKLYKSEMTALQQAGVIEGETVQTERFTQLLQDVNRHFIIPPLPVKTITTDIETINELIELNPEPFLGYRASMTVLREELIKLPRDAREDEIAIAYSSLSDKMRESLDNFSGTILKDIRDEQKIRRVQKEWKVLSTAPAQTLGEMLRTFFLLPLQRISKNLQPTSILNKNRQAIYTTVGTSEREKITRFLNLHWDVTNKIMAELNKLTSEEQKATAKRKIDEFIARLTIVIPLFVKVLRANVIPFGFKGLPYIQGSILTGLFWDFINPEDMGGALTLRNCLLFCMIKAQEPDENVLKTPEEIRKIITARNESEKVEIINELDRMTPEEKRAELLMKKLGLGRWARGASRGIFSYDEEQQTFEADERKRRGLVDFYGVDAGTGEAGGDGYDHYAADGNEEN